MGELVATLALAQDNAFGQPLESQLRSCLLARWFSDEAGYDRELSDTIYWVALLRYVGCTGHAHEVATIFGDEIAIRAQTLVHDAANPAEVMRDVLSFALANHPPEERDQVAAALQAGAHDWAVHNFAAGCEVADMLVRRLDFAPGIGEALRFTFERWNGNGFPAGASGEQIPLAMRVVHLSHDMEAIARHYSPTVAIDTAQQRRDRTYDPALVDLFTEHGAAWFEQLAKTEPWDAVLALEPTPHRTLESADLDNALTVIADFIDMKSPYMAAHSRRCAELSGDAAALLGCTEDAISAVRRAALVHEFGTTAVPNSIWDKPGPLTRAEFDRVELHPMFTEQMLRRSPALDALNPIAAAHHEKADGSGYHKRVKTTDPGAEVLTATDIYIGLTSDRADRPAFSTAYAAAELQRFAADGVLSRDAIDAVLTAAGHAQQPTSGADRPPRLPGGLTRREAQVLCIAARGFTTQQIAEQLYISPKTADHHIQNTYTKIGVSSRAAAALWAMQNGVIA